MPWLTFSHRRNPEQALCALVLRLLHRLYFRSRYRLEPSHHYLLPRRRGAHVPDQRILGLGTLDPDHGMRSQSGAVHRVLGVRAEGTGRVPTEAGAGGPQEGRLGQEAVRRGILDQVAQILLDLVRYT